MALQNMRFAPSTTGLAHPGTLLSCLLCWLDARSRGARFFIRIDNLDPERCRPEYEKLMLNDLRWLGIDWDEVVVQRDRTSSYEQALDILDHRGLLYPCTCSRARIRSIGRTSPEGGSAYDNCCRHREMPSGGWRTARGSIRIRLPDDRITVDDEGCQPIVQQPATEFGDPLVRRRDGSIAYHLACVVDDHECGVTRLVRGRDLAPLAPMQRLIQRMLELNEVTYRHHFLLLEKAGSKLAKFHGAIGVSEIRQTHSGSEICGELAMWAGLATTREPCSPTELLKTFSWSRVRPSDLLLNWNGVSFQSCDPASRQSAEREAERGYNRSRRPAAE